jgi:hypothetical protein
VEIKAQREAGIPGEAITFEVTNAPGQVVEWSGGGEPATGAGRRFVTAFPTGGDFTVSATCGPERASRGVAICPLDEWLAGARGFYGPSIDFSRVRVATSRAVWGRGGSAWTCNDVIRFKRPMTKADLPRESTLIHELGHVWEHQSGQMQLLGGLVEQIGRRFGRDPYDYGGPEGVARAERLTTFRKEGQAQILTEYWKSGHGHAKDARGAPFSTPGYVENLRRLVDDAGIGRAGVHRTGPGNLLDSGLARIVNAVLGTG